MTNSEAALKYLLKGWPIIPINPTTKKPCLESWKEFQNRLPTEEEVRDWWTKWPWANIGLVTGKISRVSVVDVDPRHGGSIEGLPETVKSQTGGGGFHYFYQYNPAVYSRNGIGEGRDLKSDGGYVILPPSTHASGNKYKWITPPFVDEFVPLPGEFKKALGARTESKFDVNNLQGVPEGKRNEAAASVIGKILHGLKEGEWLSVGWELATGWNLKNTPPLEEKELLSVFKSIVNKEKTSRIGTDNNIEASNIKWPLPMAEEAFTGLAGEVVKTIEPHSESDRVALLINFLTGFGSVIGDKAHFKVEADKHPMRLFSVLVGESSRGRKGTSWGYIKQLLTTTDPEWGKRVIGGGLSSGEGLIWAVRDQMIKRTPIKDHGHITGYEEVIEDPGITDKRLLIVESELASTLRVLGREGNTLSALIRNAWDSGNLQTLTKNSPAQATGAHIAVIGHITKEELLRYLTSTETSNGFGNRFIWVCVKRSKVLPYGGGGVDLQSLANKLAPVVSFAKSVNELTWAEETIPLWGKIYIDLTEEELGLVGSMTARSEAYVTRLACIYALLDRSTKIRIAHLKAAVAVWDYTRVSTEFIFQGRSGDSLGNKIIEALSGKPEGMTRTDIYIYFGKNIASEQISISLENLEKIGRIKKDDISPEGRAKALFTLNTLNACTHLEKNYLKKLNQYIDELDIREDSLGTHNSEESYTNNVNNVLNHNNESKRTSHETSLNSLPGLEAYGH